MNKKKKPRAFKMHPLEVAILRRKWSQQGLDAQIHALAGDSVDALMGKAGSMFWVVLWATHKDPAFAESPDRRIIRGAVSTIGNIAAVDQIRDEHRAAVSSGLEAVKRIAPTIKPERLFLGGMALQSLTATRAVFIEDFPT